MDPHGCEVQRLLEDIGKLAQQKVPHGGEKRALWERLGAQAEAAIGAFDRSRGDFRERLSEVFYTLALIGVKELRS